jgi:hypothetical protein
VQRPTRTLASAFACVLAVSSAACGAASGDAPDQGSRAPSPSPATRSATRAAPLATAYAIVLDAATLSPYQMQEVAVAAAKWEAATDGLALPTRVESCEEARPHTICVRSAPRSATGASDLDAVGVAFRDDRADGAVIELSGDDDVAYTAWIAQHELGHAMGLAHPEAPHDFGPLMAARMVDSSNEVTCEDVAAFWAARKDGPAGPCHVTWVTHLGF